MQDRYAFTIIVAGCIVMLVATIMYIYNEHKIQRAHTNAFAQQQKKFEEWQRNNEEILRKERERKQEEAQRKAEEHINPEDVTYTQKLFLDAYQKYDAAKKATQHAHIAYLEAKRIEEQANNTFEQAFHAHEQAKRGKYTRPNAANIPTDIHPSLSFFSITTADHTLVRHAYITMCKECHPDMVPENQRTQATEKTQEINMHYDKLCTHYQWR